MVTEGLGRVKIGSICTKTCSRSKVNLPLNRLKIPLSKNYYFSLKRSFLQTLSHKSSSLPPEYFIGRRGIRFQKLLSSHGRFSEGNLKVRETRDRSQTGRLVLGLT